MFERKAKDKNTIERMKIWHIETRYPGLSEKEFEEKFNSKEILEQVVYGLTVTDLTSKLLQEYKGHRNALQCKQEASELMSEIPYELIQNVNEWLDDEPLSDIKVHGVSINDVIEMYKKTRNLHFIQVLRCFADWHKSGYFDETFCEHYFSKL